ncbi:hypothetical protein GCM10018966_000430 [Streptomyces yanii]
MASGTPPAGAGSLQSPGPARLLLWSAALSASARRMAPSAAHARVGGRPGVPRDAARRRGVGVRRPGRDELREAARAVTALLRVAVELRGRPEVAEHRSTNATALEWLAAFGLLVLFALALTWIAVGMGLISPNAEAASNNAMPLILLPLLSSAFVPINAMPGWFQPIAEYQPFTPAIETLRGLLLGTEIGHNGWLAIVWCLGLAVLGYFWSASKFNSDPK